MPPSSAASGPSPSGIEQRFELCQEQLASRGQGHVLAWWESLNIPARLHLLDQVESIPWDVVDPLIESHVLNKPVEGVPGDLQPPRVYPRTPSSDAKDHYARAAAAGEALIHAGKLAAFTVAGGQGTRLGVDGPKGAVSVSPIKKKTLFQLFAETILAARQRFDAVIPWYIMTSPMNHQQTTEFFENHDFFGLPDGDVVLFSQATLPTFDLQGKLIMADKHALVLSPDGHGGSLKALVSSGALYGMRERGIEIISYFQVDNPLVRPVDELFVGLHRSVGSEMSAKVAPKADDLEKVGNICRSDGRTVVVEYSDFPEELARARNADGSRKFDAGSLGIHLFEVDFVDRIVAQDFQLPYHRAEKAVPWLDADSVRRTPPSGSRNGIKLETFVFDALPLAMETLLLQIERSEEFSPVKNAAGTDSLETAVRDQIRRAARWLKSAGVEVPYQEDGEVDGVIEIAPSYALGAEDVGRHQDLPRLRAGETLYLPE